MLLGEGTRISICKLCVRVCTRACNNTKTGFHTTLTVAFHRKYVRMHAVNMSHCCELGQRNA